MSKKKTLTSTYNTCSTSSTLACLQYKSVIVTQTKHLDYKKDFIKCYIELQYINVKYIQTNKQIVDIMTKVLYVLQIKHLTS